MSRLAGLILLLLLCALPLCAQDQQAEVSEQVTKLGSTDWATREKAQRRLVAIGEPARAALREALVNTDLEIRVRASAALIALGESFAYALECAKADSDGKRDHGKAALMSLFRLDDEQTLSMISAEELQRNNYGRGRNYNGQSTLTCPPLVALATIEASSDCPVLVASGARASWKTFIESANVSLDMSGGLDQIDQVINTLANAVANSLGNVSPDDRLLFLPMRIGQLRFIYVVNVSAGAAPLRICAGQLIADFVAGGAEGLRASRLLAAGLALDPTATSRLRAEFATESGPAALVWVALYSELDAATKNRLLAIKPEEIRTMLAAKSWVSLHAAATVLQLHPPVARAAILEPVMLASQDSLELLAAIWCARGCELSANARARVARCVDNKQDGIASSAARWFAGAQNVDDAELALVWKAAEVQPVTSAFFVAALELLTRDDIATRLLDRAREALAGRFETQQALAAAVLRGRATPADLTRVLEKLKTAQDSTLAGKLAGLFAGCKDLDAQGVSALADGLADIDALKRRRFMRVLRSLDSTLRLQVVEATQVKLDAAEEKLGGKKSAGDSGGEKDAKSVQRGVPHIVAARLALAGIKAGLGDAKAMDLLTETTRGNDIEAAKQAGAALVDALDDAGLMSTLSALKKKMAARHTDVATAAHIEQCMRAVEEGNREAYRLASGRVTAAQTNQWNWQINDQLYQMQAQLDAMESKRKSAGPLPSDPLLNSLTVDTP